MGNYVVISSIDNFPAGLTDGQKNQIIDRIEERIERITHDLFYEKKFDIFLRGNGSDRLFLGLVPDILSVSEIEISGVELPSDYWTWDKNSVYRDPAGATTSAELRWLLKQYRAIGIFPASGLSNIHIKGTMGWPEKLNIDAVSGSFEPYEIITGGTSEATAIVDEVHTTYLKIRGRDGTFEDNEGISGGTSSATADVDDTSGAINDPPDAIKQACIILCEDDNDGTIYSHYMQGQEEIGGYTYQTKVKLLTGVRRADDLLRLYVRKKPMMAVV